MKKKIFLSLLCIVVLLTLVVGCGKQEEGVGNYKTFENDIVKFKYHEKMITSNKQPGGDRDIFNLYGLPNDYASDKLCRETYSCANYFIGVTYSEFYGTNNIKTYDDFYNLMVELKSLSDGRCEKKIINNYEALICTGIIEYLSRKEDYQNTLFYNPTEKKYLSFELTIFEESSKQEAIATLNEIVNSIELKFNEKAY